MKTEQVKWKRWRTTLVILAFICGGLVLEGRIFYLQFYQREFLSAQGDDRSLRTVQISAHRGSIIDRHGEPLAVSTPVDSIWANPVDLASAMHRLPELAQVLQVDEDWLVRRVTSNLEREFVYLRRHLPPDHATRVLQLGVPGVATLREYRRYYPAGEVVGHLLGFTNIDDVGQEGLEFEFDYWLRGEHGAKRVLRDRLGRIVEDVELIKPSRPGRTLRASLDLRLQYLAYRELKQAVADHDAISGSAVVVDPATGEVLAMVNQPSYNPNNRTQYDPSRYRNRAITDIFEPGSSVKPFVVAAALESGRYQPSSVIDTSPGTLWVDGREITKDNNNLGAIDLTTILARSSNVGAAKLALQLDQEHLWSTLSRLGLGRVTESGFPGESAGVLQDVHYWNPVGQATLSYGYGISVTALQLAQAYAVIAAGGVRRPVSLLAVDDADQGEQVLSRHTAEMLQGMLETVVRQGTGRRAAVANFRVAGKTGTAWKSGEGGYFENRYLAVFGGFAPASAPRLVTVVVLDEPRRSAYYGGEVAAPIFSRIVAGGLRLLSVPPDNLSEPPLTTLTQAATAEVRQ
ncbi:MAG: penicillin-binding transpeptidase domain-containing protein [Rhodospirillaceae bacterium]|nr:penicillin-binding transpeptidase domain-containing protein [Rhodospirillaceae bacterium]